MDEGKGRDKATLSSVCIDGLILGACAMWVTVFGLCPSVWTISAIAHNKACIIRFSALC